jgi:hypothetical protein
MTSGNGKYWCTVKQEAIKRIFGLTLLFCLNPYKLEDGRKMK